jgi:homocysteine S-methyltransferase
MTPRDQIDLLQFRVLDGGMATELEFLGADISGPLWSAHILEDAPEDIATVHRAYLDAGADILLSASYQVSRKAYADFGLDPVKADSALMRAALISWAVRETPPGKKALLAESLGPYGAALHDGSEYHGNYDCSFSELVDFHRERIAVLVNSGMDLLAFETLPSLEEAQAIGEALAPWPDLAAWFTFTCPDERAAKLQVAHGESLRECAALAASFPQTIAVGVNCTHPRWITSLIRELRLASSKPIVVYPNSGEVWDAAARRWTGSGDPVKFGDLAREWYAAGAQIVGGCCRTRPDHIRQITAAAR